jgi:hypothetical protein
MVIKIFIFIFVSFLWLKEVVNGYKITIKKLPLRHHSFLLSNENRLGRTALLAARNSVAEKATHNYIGKNDKTAKKPLSDISGTLGKRDAGNSVRGKAGAIYGAKSKEEVLEKSWKSGSVLLSSSSTKIRGADAKNSKSVNRRRRNDPWWMSEAESKNPRILPPYKPWWMESQSTVAVDETWKLVDLKAEAMRRGWSDTRGNKLQLIDGLNKQLQLYSLHDDNFMQASVIQSSQKEMNSCYPEVYEGSMCNVEELRKKLFIST